MDAGHHEEEDLDDYKQPFSGERASESLIKRLYSLAAEITDEIELDELLAGIQDAYGYSWEEADTLARTAMTLRFRLLDEATRREIEKGFRGETFRYVYIGPDDKLTRPFCRELMRRTADRPMTLAEIAELDNGELPNVLVTGGGWCCRHQWILNEENAG